MSLVAEFEALKNMVAPPGELGRTILHIHIGMAIYLGLRLASRRRFGPVLALVGLVLLETLNESMDLAATWPVIQNWQIRDTQHDVFNTLLWPVVLCALELWLMPHRTRKRAR